MTAGHSCNGVGVVHSDCRVSDAAVLVQSFWYVRFIPLYNIVDSACLCHLTVPWKCTSWLQRDHENENSITHVNNK